MPKDKELNEILDEPMSYIEAHTGNEEVRAKTKAAILKLYISRAEVLEMIGEDIHLNEDNCPKYLRPQDGESWESVIRYEQGINHEKAELRQKLGGTSNADQ